MSALIIEVVVKASVVVPGLTGVLALIWSLVRSSGAYPKLALR